MNGPVWHALMCNIHMEISLEEYYGSNKPWLTYLHKWWHPARFSSAVTYGPPPSMHWTWWKCIDRCTTIFDRCFPFWITELPVKQDRDRINLRNLQFFIFQIDAKLFLLLDLFFRKRKCDYNSHRYYWPCNRIIQLNHYKIMWHETERDFNKKQFFYRVY